mgnify:CR=1 FL=1
MNVEHRLPGFAVAVEDGPVATLVVSVLPRQFRCEPHHRAHQRIVHACEVIERRDMPAGDDQRVQGRLRIDVAE